jgi:hypothetical protein
MEFITTVTTEDVIIIPGQVTKDKVCCTHMKNITEIHQYIIQGERSNKELICGNCVTHLKASFFTSIK